MQSNQPDRTGLPILVSTETSLDTKYRVLIPKEVRDRLGNNFAFWIGELGCIYACTAARWAAQMAQMEQLPGDDEGRREYHRLCYRYASDLLNWEEQGRIVIPDKLRKAANIDHEVYLEGQIEHLEIWALDEWKKHEELGQTYNRLRRLEIEHARKLMGAATRQVNPVEEALRRGIAD